MDNKAKNWFLMCAFIVGIILVVSSIIYIINKGNQSDINIINSTEISEEENDTFSNTELENELVETSSGSDSISPNAIIVEKRYYEECDHLIRETVDVPEELVNQGEEELQEYYVGWTIEKYSATEITVYKEFSGYCNEHYIVKENNGILSVYTQDENGVQEWLEDTQIEVKYLPDEDVENFEVGVEVVGKSNLYEFLEDYE